MFYSTGKEMAKVDMESCIITQISACYFKNQLRIDKHRLVKRLTPAAASLPEAVRQGV